MLRNMKKTTNLHDPRQWLSMASDLLMADAISCWGPARLLTDMPRCAAIPEGSGFDVLFKKRQNLQKFLKFIWSNIRRIFLGISLPFFRSMRNNYNACSSPYTPQDLHMFRFIVILGRLTLTMVKVHWSGGVPKITRPDSTTTSWC